MRALSGNPNVFGYGDSVPDYLGVPAASLGDYQTSWGKYFGTVESAF